MLESVLHFVSPMPPLQNGIADYTFIVAQELSKHARVRIVSDDPFAIVPSGTALCDPEQIFRFAGRDARFLYQIGNNPDHAFVLRALRQFPGIVTLHDLSLFYLYEVSGTTPERLSELMMEPDASLGRLWLLHQRSELGGAECRHVLFDMLGEILSASTHVIVHSDFAKTKITKRYGRKFETKVSVIPHFAPAVERYDRQTARRMLDIPAGEMLILTSGFATRAKRFDWIIAALRTVARSGRQFRWIHAGNERAAEYPLSKEIARAAELAGRASVTGYLAENDLDHYIAAADIVLNLRFPSVGESSGTLARSYAAGVCCVVSDTAGYAELPSDRVIHIPVSDAPVELARAICFLIDNPDVIASMGDRVRRWAVEDLSVAEIGRQYLSVLSSQSAVARTPDALLEPQDDVAIDRLAGSSNVAEAIAAALRRFRRAGCIRVSLGQIVEAASTPTGPRLREIFEKQGFRIEDVFLHGAVPRADGSAQSVSEMHIHFTAGL